MAATATTITPKQLEWWGKQNRSLAQEVLAATAHAKAERKRVNAYILPLFRTYGFCDNQGKEITDPERLYLCEDEARVTEYFQACDTAHRAHGFTGPEGNCPALSAEWDLCQIENKLLKSGGALFHAEMTGLCGEQRQRALSLLLSACIGKEVKRAA